MSDNEPQSPPWWLGVILAMIGVGVFCLVPVLMGLVR